MTIKRTLQVLALTIIALIVVAVAGRAQTQQHAWPKLSAKSWMRLQQNPQAWNAFVARLPLVPANPEPTPVPPSGPWQLVTNKPGTFSLSNPLLLPDGTVMMQNTCTTNWYKLTPDNTGNYVNGTWTTLASSPYAPLFFGSAVLADGRVIIEGGEYDSCSAVWTNKGAIYDPASNSWTSVSPPGGWSSIGDAQSIVLPNLTFMVADCCHIVFQGGSPQAALLNATSLTWTITGSSKADDYDEEGWTLLPSGKVLTVDAYTSIGTCGTNSETYDPSTGAWSTAGSVINQLADCNSTSENGGPSYEMGPVPLRPDGTAVAFGATTNTSGPNAIAHSSIYNSSSGTWTSGPNIPTINNQNYNLADAAAAVLPTGNILFGAGPGLFNAPTHFFEFNTSNVITQVPDTSDASTTPSFEWYMLVLPSGQILAVPGQTGTGNVWIYTPSGSVNSNWAPVISSVPTNLSPGATCQLSGVQLNGLSQGAYYGDDAQAATNYPIVRITNNATGHVFFANTSGWSNGSIAPNNTSNVNFKVPSSIENGVSSLVAIANGIPSQPVSVTVGTTNNCGSSNYTLSVSVFGNPGGTVSSPSGINCGSTCSKSFSSGTQVTLTATPDTAWGFFGWSGGGCSGLAPTCTVTLNGNTSVSATFSTLFGAEQMSGTAILPAPVIVPYPQTPIAY
jgi:hypothetical protein